MKKMIRKYDSLKWTGFSEPVEAEIILAALVFGAVCIAVIGAVTL